MIKTPSGNVPYLAFGLMIFTMLVGGALVRYLHRLDALSEMYILLIMSTLFAIAARLIFLANGYFSRHTIWAIFGSTGCLLAAFVLFLALYMT